MGKYGVSLIPTIVFEHAESNPYHYEKTKTDRSGSVYTEQINEFLFSAPVVYRWVNNENPEEYIEVPWYVTGSQQDPSQAMGSGLTYGLRYFLTQYFQISTPEDDPDNWRSKQIEAEKEQDKIILMKMISSIEEVVAKINETNTSLLPEVKKVVGKYVKVNGKSSANYRKVSNISDAAAILKELKNLTTEKTED